MARAKKDFDAVEMMRSIRAKISAEIEHMTLEEELAWLAARELNDPFLEELRRKAQQQPVTEDKARHR
jgi:hypothetical protein